MLELLLRGIVPATLLLLCVLLVFVSDHLSEVDPFSTGLAEAHLAVGVKAIQDLMS